MTTHIGNQERTFGKAMKRQEVILRAINGSITWIQAAEILGISDRQMRRIKRRYEASGFGCLVDKRVGRPSWNQRPLDHVKKVLALYRESYFDFNVKHFHEKLVDEHGIKESYSWVKKILQDSGLVSRNRKREKHRLRRERKPLPGMLIHLDGSDHHWLGTSREPWDLLAIMDDATNEVYDAFFVDEEDTRSVLAILRSVVEKQGVFCSLYTDRATHFIVTLKAGEKAEKGIRTQCQRVLDQMGIRLIPAYSPQARGRGERLWRTYQGRLPQELRVAGVKTMDEANKYLREVFLPDYNKRFKVKPKESGTAFVPVLPGLDLEKVFSIQSPRQVRLDNTLSYKTLTLQIPESPFRHSFAKTSVTVHEHLDGRLSVAYGPHTLAWYTEDGILINDKVHPKRFKQAA